MIGSEARPLGLARFVVWVSQRISSFTLATSSAKRPYHVRQHQHPPTHRVMLVVATTMSAYQLYSNTLSVEGLEDSIEPQPVIDLLRYRGFPQTARQRELAKEATRFAANAIYLFCHHVTPVLEARRKALLATSTRRKKYHKSADLIWRALPHDQSFFWEHHAQLVRQALKDGTLSAEQCLQNAGFRDEWLAYRRFAEMAVADYLELPMPEYVQEAPPDDLHLGEQSAASAPPPHKSDAEALALAVSRMQAMDDALERKGPYVLDNTKDHILPAYVPTDMLSDKTMDRKLYGPRPNLRPMLKGVETHVADSGEYASPPRVSPSILDNLGMQLGHYRTSSRNTDTLLDTLSETFGPVTSRMIYGNFVQLYPYTVVHNAATSKHATALLRQLADLLDPTGKEFFYYYVYPHLWKYIKPTEVDETIAAVAHGLWQFLKGKDKEGWRRASRDAKKLLGDGDINGLTRLALESKDPDTLKLHEMMRKALREDKMRRVELREMKREREGLSETEL
ncbi:hypothetical protein CLAFUW4_10372 [Fulvia fulva]|nr:hypothetical protein CLAFUR4_10376 [Fulvia fulva]WPV19082.1 hypothetical protein CLAFUW4_10372 [Fulvia fulva]WPV34516.1 hypothetical protein CLAFUW7_10372 [Fulvia fulva]